MQEWLPFIESNTTGTGRLFALAARNLGVCPVVLASDPSRYPFLAEDHIEVRVVDTLASDRVWECIQALQKTGTIAGVLTSSEYFIEASAQTARRLALPGNAPSALHRCRDKHLQLRTLREAGIAVPDFRLAASMSEAIDASREISLPVVVKPVTGSGSVGVKLCDSFKDLMDHVNGLLARRTNERGVPTRPEVLIQEYEHGCEYSAEWFSGEIIGITAKHLSARPFFIETGHDFPAKLDTRQQSEIRTVIARAAGALGLVTGPAHIEFRLTRRGAVIIEFNARLAGGFIPELVRRARGIDLIAATVRHAIKSPVHLSPTRRFCSSIRFLVARQAGRIAAIAGTTVAERIPGVCDVQLYRRKGDAISVYHDFRDRLGHVMSCSIERRSAARIANRALAALEVVMEQ
jgi:biotin carboxylase